MDAESKSKSAVFAHCAPESPDLQQGDLIAKTPAIASILKDAHPFYLKPDYTHFLVLTQTCDLVRRHGALCKARYITLAAVRPLSVVINREIARNQDQLTAAANACTTRVRERLVDFLKSLFNNNQSEYFYLHENHVFGLAEPQCAFLRLAIPLRVGHYDACLSSRILSLTEVFQAKLGWLTGNMYSRVGTEDWVPTHVSEESFVERINGLLDTTCHWVDEKQLKAAKRGLTPELLAAGVDALREHIAQQRAPKRRGEVLRAVLDELRELGLVKDGAEELRISRRLSNNVTFKQYTEG